MSAVISTLALVASLASSVAAHGYVQGLIVGGTYYEGYSPSMQYDSPPPSVIGWSDPEDLGNGFIASSDYTSPDIICHLNATNAPISATIAAGEKVEFQWTDWPSSHHGPVLTYIANCNGDCSTVDKTVLKFVKIDEGGLDSDADVPGTWATDDLIANNNSWTTTIPSSIVAGNYVIRHEIIALHSAGTAGGAQNYPQCMNLKITGTGTDSPTGTLGEALYQESAAGILIDIYTSLSTYDIPGPTLYSGASTGAQSTASAAATSTAAASSVSTKAAVLSTSSSSSTTTSAAVSMVTATATAVVTDQAYTTVTASASAATGASNGTAAPAKALPAGTTLADLLGWIQDLFTKDSAASKVKARSHARDMVAAR